MGIWIYLGDVFPDGFASADGIDRKFIERRGEREDSAQWEGLIPKFYNFEQVLRVASPDPGFEYNGKMQLDDIAIPVDLFQRISYADTMHLTNVDELLLWMNAGYLYRDSWIKLPTSSKAGVPSVFHYTSSIGAIGIMESRRFRASSIRFLNDRKEFDLGLELVEGMVRDLRNDLFVGPDQKSFVKEVLAEVKSTLQRSQLFVLCASKNGDSLSQWRGYGKDHTGEAAGYSLGVHGGSYGFIDNGGLLANSPSRLPYRRWHNVYYDENSQAVLLKQVLAFCIGLVPRVPNRRAFLKTSQYSILLTLASSVLIDSIAICKHESFKEEEEVRMIFTLPQGDRLTKHRPGGTGIVPYIDIQMTRGNPWLGILDAIRNTGFAILQNEPLPLESIIVGPSASPQIAETGLSSLTHTTGHQNVLIDRSCSPYR